MNVKLLTEHHLEFLSSKGGCTCSSAPSIFKMPHCWKPHVLAQMFISISTTCNEETVPYHPCWELMPEFFLLVDLREFFSDLGSGGRKKKEEKKL